MVEERIKRSQEIFQLASEMSQHYYHKPLIICYSGGKDSDVILRLAMDCLTPDEFEVLHSITTVDSPITNKYVNEIFKELKEKGIKCEKSIPVGKDGKPTNMWKLIANRGIPPTRLVRYCCSELKETKTPNRVAVLGVRAKESTKRQGRDVFGVRGGTYKQAKFFSLDHTEEVHREALKHENEQNGSVWDCTLIKMMRENKDTVVNPIYEWSDADVWDFIKQGNYPYNPMYDMGYHRVGCIGCPLATYKQKMKEFSDFPTYKQLYIKAFDEMIRISKEKGKTFDENSKRNWVDGQAVFDWWIEEYKYNVKGQISIEEYLNESEEEE